MLYLSKEHLDNIILHSLQEAPNECCGILAGKKTRVEKLYKMTNTDKSAATFFMSPEEQLKVMKEIRDLNLEMIAIYHSHPETKAYPSAHDVELAYYPEISYVIISLKDKNNPNIKSFKIQNRTIAEEELNIT